MVKGTIPLRPEQCIFLNPDGTCGYRGDMRRLEYYDAPLPSLAQEGPTGPRSDRCGEPKSATRKVHVVNL